MLCSEMIYGDIRGHAYAAMPHEFPFPRAIGVTVACGIPNVPPCGTTGRSHPAKALRPTGWVLSVTGDEVDLNRNIWKLGRLECGCVGGWTRNVSRAKDPPKPVETWIAVL